MTSTPLRVISSKLWRSPSTAALYILSFSSYSNITNSVNYYDYNIANWETIKPGLDFGLDSRLDSAMGSLNCKKLVLTRIACMSQAQYCWRTAKDIVEINLKFLVSEGNCQGMDHLTLPRILPKIKPKTTLIKNGFCLVCNWLIIIDFTLYLQEFIISCTL